MANGEKVEILDPQVANYVARAKAAYLGLAAIKEQPYTWEELRPRLIRRLNHDFRISEEDSDQ